ncbi:hypothetical protein CY35_14G009500 [Sphagnum magellanicum]|nr:hypothetical protein CY35_14G009500 [Sphagnum magellanicum]
MNEKYKPCVQHKYGSQCINGKRLKVSCGRIAPPSQRYGFYKQYGFAGQGAKTSHGWHDK